MLCAVCDKESANRRVCPYCFTPYPTDAPTPRAVTGSGRHVTGSQRVPTGAGGNKTVPSSSGLPVVVDQARAFVMRQTPVVRWSAVGILVVLVLWAFTSGGDGATEVPASVPSDLVATPTQRDEAIALIKLTRENALVETQADEVMVSYPAANFPLEEAGQLALAQAFARADEIVEVRKRRIVFYNPSGRVFAQSDGVTGVTIKR